MGKTKTRRVPTNSKLVAPDVLNLSEPLAEHYISKAASTLSHSKADVIKQIADLKSEHARLIVLDPKEIQAELVAFKLSLADITRASESDKFIALDVHNVLDIDDFAMVLLRAQILLEKMGLPKMKLFGCSYAMGDGIRSLVAIFLKTCWEIGIVTDGVITSSRDPNQPDFNKGAGIKELVKKHGGDLINWSLVDDEPDNIKSVANGYLWDVDKEPIHQLWARIYKL